MKTIRITALILAVLLMVSLVACGDKIPLDNAGDVDVDVTPVETTAPVPEIKEFTLTSAYTVVRPDEGDELEVEALQLLMRGVKSAYGINLKAGSDFVRPDADIVRGEYEILVGQTNRPESVELAETQTYYDWSYRVVSENVIVICGGSPAATLEATVAFLRDVVGYTEDENGQVISGGSGVVLSTAMGDDHYYEYTGAELKIGDRSAGEYTVVTPSYDAGAKLIAMELGRLSGKVPQVVEPAEFEGGPAIYFGCADKSGSHLDRSPFGSARYYITVAGEDIIIDFKTASVAKHAANAFIQTLHDSGDSLLSRLSDGELTGIYVSKGLNDLSLQSSTKATITDGIVYTSQLYYDPAGNPVRVYLLTVEAGAGVFYTGLPSDGMTIGKVQNVRNQMKAAAGNGKKVVAGINADFFDMGGTNVMRGLCIKDGVELTPPDGRPWFGVTTEGTPVIGTAAEYAQHKATLTTAVGGSHIVLRGDKVHDIAVGTDFADTRHPRTAVGFKPDGAVVLMVVDGRQSAVSDGASLADLARIFGTLGCSDAINLDGGGSSTFVIAAGNEFVTKNSPSDGALRSVANGLLVLAP